MGLDCSLFAFPQGRIPREYDLDRYWIFDDVLNALHLIGAADERVSVLQMREVLQAMPPITGDLEYKNYWVAKAVGHCDYIIRRWGPETRVMILSEHQTCEVWPRHDPWTPNQTLLRLERMREAKAKRRRTVIEAENADGYMQVKRQLMEKIARQWD